jgi:hypothetical protein
MEAESLICFDAVTWSFFQPIHVSAPSTAGQVEVTCFLQLFVARLVLNTEHS